MRARPPPSTSPGTRPTPAAVPAGGTPVTFTFVVRDERGGADWTTRTACVTP